MSQKSMTNNKPRSKKSLKFIKGGSKKKLASKGKKSFKIVEKGGMIAQLSRGAADLASKIGVATGTAKDAVLPDTTQKLLRLGREKPFNIEGEAGENLSLTSSEKQTLENLYSLLIKISNFGDINKLSETDRFVPEKLKNNMTDAMFFDACVGQLARFISKINGKKAMATWGIATSIPRRSVETLKNEFPDDVLKAAAATAKNDFFADTQLPPVLSGYSKDTILQLAAKAAQAAQEAKAA